VLKGDERQAVRVLEWYKNALGSALSTEQLRPFIDELYDLIAGPKKAGARREGGL
jgi:hypothetical protein